MSRTRTVNRRKGSLQNEDRLCDRRNARRLARGGVLVLLAGLLTVVGAVYYMRHEEPAYAQGPPIDPPLPEPGSARPWEAQIPVSTYSSVHTRHGNLLTAIPIVSWSGRGPDLSMTLYHNAANVDSPLDLTAGMGFDLGPGWTVSYSARLIFDDPQNPTSIIAVADDGTQDVYTWDGNQWVPPPGVHDQLAGDPSPQTGPDWILKHKDQSKHEFNQDGHLVKVVDATGNYIEITRDAIRITSITDAAGRQLVFNYDGNGRLETILDPREESDPSELQNRSWQFSYDANERLDKVVDPMLFENVITYHSEGRIQTLSDKKHQGTTGDFYTYGYDSEGRLVQVTDPEPDSPTQWRLTQGFTLEAYEPGVIYAAYTDRRGNDWGYTYVPAAGLAYPEANLYGIANPLNEFVAYEYDAERNMVWYEDALYHQWDLTYYDRGNMESLTDPLSHVQSWTYDEYNNVTSYTDAAGNKVRFSYQHAPEYPTLLTMIEEPPAGPVPPDTGTTTLDYYLDGSPGHGQLKEVIDPNGVWTHFDYDLWGQLATYSEGRIEIEPEVWSVVYSMSLTTDSAGRVISTSGCPEGGGAGGAAGAGTTGGSMSYNANNWPTGSTCPPLAAGATSAAEPPSGFPELPRFTNLPTHRASFSVPDWGYTPKGELESMTVNGTLRIESSERTVETYERTHSADFDELGRVTWTRISTDSSRWAGSIGRDFDHVHDWSTGEYWRTGPDGVETYVQLDVANRVALVRRGPENDPLMTAEYTYYANGLLQSTTYGNATSTWYTYDYANRLTTIEHRRPPDETILMLEYVYTDNDLVETITEHDNTPNLVARVTFQYDARRRLISEVRVDNDDPARGYNLAYEYDQGGNRTKKTETFSPFHRIETAYYYDVRPEEPDPQNPQDYGSFNNRLMFYQRTEFAPGGMEQQSFGGGVGAMRFGGPGGQTETLLSTTWYYYSPCGNVTRVVTRDETQTPNPSTGWLYLATLLGYAANGDTVTYALGERWRRKEDGWRPTNYTVTYAREFRYDTARQRYLNHEVVPSGDWEPVPGGEDIWSDYDGDEIYGDFTIDGGTVTELRSFELGIGKVDPWTDAGDANTTYYHADLIGTLRTTSDAAGAGTGLRVLTAFGKHVSGDVDRYGYAGAWGYQTHDEFPFLHVGARYYDPSTGRFLQRDPNGIAGGLNPYEYVRSHPTWATDPEGLHGDYMDQFWMEMPSKKAEDAYEKARRKIRGVAMLCIGNPWSKLPFLVRLGLWLGGWGELLL